MSSGHPQGCVRWTKVKPGRSLVNVLVSRRIGSLCRLVRTALLRILRRRIELARLLWILWWHIELTWVLRELTGVLAICIDRRLCSEGHIYVDGCSNAGWLCLVPVPAT